MPQRDKKTLRLSAAEETLLNDAAEIMLLNKTDFVRLAVNRVLRDLWSSVADRVALHAQCFFLEEVGKRWACPFEAIDFASAQIQLSLIEMRAKDPCRSPITIGNARLELNGDDGVFESAFDGIPSDEIPRIADTRKQNSMAFVNAAEPVSLEMAILVARALHTNQNSETRSKNKEVAKAAVQEQIRQNYRSLIDRYLAIPKLLVAARRHGAPASFIQKYRQDPCALFTLISYLRLSCITGGDPTDPQKSLTELRECAIQLGADEPSVRRNRNNRNGLIELIKELRFDEEVMWLSSPTVSADHFREFHSS